MSGDYTNLTLPHLASTLPTPFHLLSPSERSLPPEDPNSPYPSHLSLPASVLSSPHISRDVAALRFTAEMVHTLSVLRLALRHERGLKENYRRQVSDLLRYATAPWNDDESRDEEVESEATVRVPNGPSGPAKGNYSV